MKIKSSTFDLFFNSYPLFECQYTCWTEIDIRFNILKISIIFNILRFCQNVFILVSLESREICDSNDTNISIFGWDFGHMLFSSYFKRNESYWLAFKSQINNEICSKFNRELNGKVGFWLSLLVGEIRQVRKKKCDYLASGWS